MQKKKTINVCVRLTEETAKRLRKKAKGMKTTQSAIVERGIKRQLEMMEI